MSLYHVYVYVYIISGQIAIIPKPKCFRHFGRIPLLNTTFLGEFPRFGLVTIICPDITYKNHLLIKGDLPGTPQGHGTPL